MANVTNPATPTPPATYASVRSVLFEDDVDADAPSSAGLSVPTTATAGVSAAASIASDLRSPATSLTLFVIGAWPGVSTTTSALPGRIGTGSLHPPRRTSSPPTLSVVVGAACATL